MTVLKTVRTAIEKRVAYSRLKHELATMPKETAIDLGMFREDASKIASKAIYGRSRQPAFGAAQIGGAKAFLPGYGLSKERVNPIGVSTLARKVIVACAVNRVECHV
jgi:hypothetical protein